MFLPSIGADERVLGAFHSLEEDGLELARVALAQREVYQLLTETGLVLAEPAGKLYYRAEEGAGMPSTGDWVAVRRAGAEFALVERVLPRRTVLSRRAAGTREEEQVLAANVDVVFLVCGLDGDFNVRRIERYLALVAAGGAKAVVVLNKADLCGGRGAGEWAFGEGIEERSCAMEVERGGPALKVRGHSVSEGFAAGRVCGSPRPDAEGQGVFFGGGGADFADEALHDGAEADEVAGGPRPDAEGQRVFLGGVGADVADGALHGGAGVDEAAGGPRPKVGGQRVCLGGGGGKEGGGLEWLSERRAEAEAVARQAPVVLASTRAEGGLDGLKRWIGPGQTVALLGSSGVGKSSIVNALVGEARLRTAEVRVSDSRGRHTTVRRELIPLEGGGALIDTPGMRELQLWVAPEGLDTVFDEIAELGTECRFRDCTHTGEPGCAVAAGLAEGRVDEARMASYRKLRAEAEWHESQADPLAALERKKKWKAIHKEIKRYNQKFRD